MFSEHLACTHCGVSFDELAPRNFSFNSPYGACERCDGLGTRFEVDPELVVPDDDLSLSDGAIAPWSGFRSHYFERVLESVADGVSASPLDTPWKKLKKKDKQVGALRHRQDRRSRCRTATATDGSVRTPRSSRVWCRGSSVATPSPRATAPASRSRATCARCRARRAAARACGPASLAVTIGGKNIYEVGELSIRKASEFLGSLELSERDRMIAERVEKEVNERLRFLLDVGLDYLSLNRSSATLAGGEAQRIRLASQIGSGLGGRALRARRAVDRSAPARQPAPHRHA